MQMIIDLLSRLLNWLKASGGKGKKTAGWLAVTIAIVAPFEGLRTAAYRDPVGIPTICFGETQGVRMGDTATEAECSAMLANRLAEFRTGLTQCLPALPNLPDPIQAAFVSWSYNVGTGAACRSGLVRKAKAGDLRGACEELLKWDKATVAGRKVALPGLTRRRVAERDLCLSGLP